MSSQVIKRIREQHQLKHVNSLFSKPYRWCNGYHARLVCGGSLVRAKKKNPKDYEFGICLFFSKHALFSIKSKDWFAQNQDNVSE